MTRAELDEAFDAASHLLGQADLPTSRASLKRFSTWTREAREIVEDVAERTGGRQECIRVVNCYVTHCRKWCRQANEAVSGPSPDSEAIANEAVSGPSPDSEAILIAEQVLRRCSEILRTEFFESARGLPEALSEVELAIVRVTAAREKDEKLPVSRNQPRRSAIRANVDLSDLM